MPKPKQKQKPKPPTRAKRATPRKAKSPRWDEQFRSVFADKATPAAVRVAAIEALLEGLPSLDERGRAALAKWATQRLADKHCDDWRIRFRLEAIHAALQSARHAGYTAKWTMNEHWTLSDAALEGIGWSRSDLAPVVDANLATDLDWVVAHWWGRPYALLWPRSAARVDAVRACKASMADALIAAGITEPAQREPHFDDLFTYDDIRRSYLTFTAWATEAMRGIRRGSREFADLLGLVHHAVQDFYCHTNWVEICQRSGVAAIPTWEQVEAQPQQFAALRAEFARSNTETTEEPSSSRVNPRTRGGLQSGAWTLETFRGRRPWRHRHPAEGDAAHDPAMKVAIAATQEWTKRLGG